jgi:hypothetical protein
MEEATWPSPPHRNAYFFLAPFFAGFFAAAFFVAMKLHPLPCLNALDYYVWYSRDCAPSKIFLVCDLSFAVHVSHALRPMSHKFIFTISVQYQHADCGAFIRLFLDLLAHERDSIYQSLGDAPL